MAHRTRAGRERFPHSLCIEDLKRARWFLRIVVHERRAHGLLAGRQDEGILHSHAVDLEEPDGNGGRKLVSLAALFRAEWPHVPVSDLLLALAQVGFISLSCQEPDGYTFRLTPDCRDPGASC